MSGKQDKRGRKEFPEPPRGHEQVGAYMHMMLGKSSFTSGAIDMPWGTQKGILLPYELLRSFATERPAGSGTMIPYWVVVQTIRELLEKGDRDTLADKQLMDALLDLHKFMAKRPAQT